MDGGPPPKPLDYTGHDGTHASYYMRGWNFVDTRDIFWQCQKYKEKLNAQRIVFLFALFNSRFMLCQWSFLGLSAVLFLASCFAGWRAFAVMVLACRARPLCLIHSFPAGQRNLSPAAKRRSGPPPFELSCGHGLVWAVGFFMLTFGISLSEGALSAGVLAGRYLCAALYKTSALVS